MSIGAYNTRSLLAPLICLFFLYWSVFNLFIVFFSFFSFFFLSLGVAIDYLMQIVFISLHFLYDKGLLLPSSMQSAFKWLSVLLCVLFWTPVFSTRIRMQIVASSLDLKQVQALHLEYCKNEVHVGSGEERKKELSSCAEFYFYVRGLRFITISLSWLLLWLWWLLILSISLFHLKEKVGATHGLKKKKKKNACITD